MNIYWPISLILFIMLHFNEPGKKMSSECIVPVIRVKFEDIKESLLKTKAPILFGEVYGRSIQSLGYSIHKGQGLGYRAFDLLEFGNIDAWGLLVSDILQQVATFYEEEDGIPKESTMKRMLGIIVNELTKLHETPIKPLV